MKKRTFAFVLLIALGTMWVFSSTTSCQNNQAAKEAQEDLDRAGENLKDAAEDVGAEAAERGLRSGGCRTCHCGQPIAPTLFDRSPEFRN